MREAEAINDEGMLAWPNGRDPDPDFYSYHDDIRDRYLKNPKEANADQECRNREEFYKELGYECPVLWGSPKLNYSFEQKFGDDIYAQPVVRMLDFVDFAVVSISSFIDDVRLFTCSGTIIENKGGSSIISTSACLVAVQEKDDTRKVADNVKINVRFRDGMACAAKLLGCCLHYNVAFVVVEKKDQVSSLPLQGEVIESVPDVVFALGRHYVSREFMAARGKNILKPNRFDCQELMFSSCKITKCGIGGPLVNSRGELVGVNFYDENYTPYLPSFLVSKCWEHLKIFGYVRHFYFGGRIRPFQKLKVQEWSFLHHHVIPESLLSVNNGDGLLVEEVQATWSSPADGSKISEGDIILELFGEPVVTCPVPKYAALLLDRSKIMPEEFFDKVEVRILRRNYHSEEKKQSKKRSRSATSSQKADLCSRLYIYPTELSSCHYNRWPLPQPEWTYIPGKNPMFDRGSPSTPPSKKKYGSSYINAIMAAEDINMWRRKTLS